ncbi:MAG TPA: tetratricopeptide repeat protein [Pyrinomonadaceae bacterium]|nr:tetratricopeptide repeat protein [Pyrinomonadaceae bacterium]
MIGTTVSHYRIIELLGEGGMGIVYLAEDTVLGRKVAIKTLTEASGTGNQQFRTRFLREARAVSALSHPHIATIHDYGETPDGQPYIVMEFIRGETLADLMLKGTLTIPRALEIVTEVAEALGEAHSHGIIHRDIKPSNVAINHRGEVKVLDFGLAKQILPGFSDSLNPEGQTLLSAQTREGVIVGTPMYLSPEQALGSEVDARSDLFSLGGVLYECLAGKPAFFGVSPMEICTKVIRDEPTPPSQVNADVPEELDRIILKSLAKKPDHRYQTAGELISDLEAARAQAKDFNQAITRMIPVSPHTYPTGTMATLTDIFKRPRLPVGYAVAGVVLLAILAFTLWKITRPSLHEPSEQTRQLYARGVDAMREGAFFRASKILQQATQDDDRFALAHARLAEVWTELDSSDKAKDELIRATELVPDRSVLPQIDGLRLQAVMNTVKRDFGGAVEDYKALAAIVPATEKAFALVDLGRAYDKHEKSDKAIETYQEATKVDSRYAAAFLRLGIVLGRRSRYDDAHAAFDHAHGLFDLSSDIEGLTEVLLQRAVLLGLQGKAVEARAQLLQALEKSAALENKDKRIRVLLNLSNTEIIAGDAEKAQLYSSQALELARSNGLDNLTMQGLIDIGNSYFIKGNFPEAEKSFNEALRLSQLYKGRRSEARALLSLASLASKQGNTDTARGFFQRALPFYEQGGYRKEVFQAYIILGRAEGRNGDYDSAQRRFEQLLQLAQQAADPQSVALAQEGLGSVFLDRQDFPQALAHYNATYETLKTLNAKLNMGYIASNRAEALWQLGRYQEARAALAESQEIAEPKGHEPYKDLQLLVHLIKARLALSERKLHEASVEAKKVLGMTGTGSNSTAISAEYVLGLTQSLSGQAGEGRKHCEAAASAARNLRSPLLLSNSLLALAECALLAGDAQAASTVAGEAQQRFAAAGQNASEWRALLIEALAHEKSGDKTRSQHLALQASGILTALEQKWGNENYQTYLERPDVKESRQRLQAGIPVQ